MSFRTLALVAVLVGLPVLAAEPPKPPLPPPAPGDHTNPAEPASRGFVQLAREVQPNGVFPMSRFLLSAVAVGLVAGLAPGAEPSPEPGTAVTPFHPLHVNGAHAGEKACAV